MPLTHAVSQQPPQPEARARPNELVLHHAVVIHNQVIEGERAADWAATPLLARQREPQMTAISTTLGLRHGVWFCLERSLQDWEAGRPSVPTSCCDWTCKIGCAKALDHQLCCSCFLLVFMVTRVLLMVPVLLLLTIGNLIVSLALVLPSIFLFYRSVIIRSERVGPCAKMACALLFPLVALLSPVVITTLSLFYGLVLPFKWPLQASLLSAFRGVSTLATLGFLERTASYAEV
jgi:hypothetical protein